MRCGSAPLRDQMRDAVRQRVGLARAGAGDHQQRAGGLAARHAVLDGPALLGVQAGEIGVRVGVGRDIVGGRYGGF